MKKSRRDGSEAAWPLCPQRLGSRRDVVPIGTRSTIRVQVDTESIEQPRPAGRGQPQRAGIALAREPAEREAAAPDLRAHQTGDVIAALAPIEAGPAEDAFAARAAARRRSRSGSARRRPSPRRRRRRGRCEPLATSASAIGDADLAGQVVVAGAREAQRLVTDGARLIARRHLDGGDRDDAFEHPRHQRRGDAVIAIAPLLGDGDQPRLDQLDQVLAGGRARDAGEITRARCRSAPGRPSGQPEWSRARCPRRAPRPRPDLRRQPWRTLPPRRRLGKQRQFGLRRTNRRATEQSDLAAAFSVGHRFRNAHRTRHEGAS